MAWSLSGPGQTKKNLKNKKTNKCLIPGPFYLVLINVLERISYVMFVETNLKTLGNTWTKSTKTNKSYPGPLPDVLGQKKCGFGFRGFKYT